MIKLLKIFWYRYIKQVMICNCGSLDISFSREIPMNYYCGKCGKVC